MIVDANVLIYAADIHSPYSERADAWLTAQLNGVTRIGLPWSSLSAFVRVSTHRRLLQNPLEAADAWGQVTEWLAAPAAWVPLPTRSHADVFGRLLTEHRCTGNLVPDAELAALALEHGTQLASTDTDFARFTPELTWVNPLSS